MKFTPDTRSNNDGSHTDKPKDNNTLVSETKKTKKSKARRQRQRQRQKERIQERKTLQQQRQRARSDSLGMDVDTVGSSTGDPHHPNPSSRQSHGNNQSAHRPRNQRRNHKHNKRHTNVHKHVNHQPNTPRQRVVHVLSHHGNNDQQSHDSSNAQQQPQTNAQQQPQANAQQQPQTNAQQPTDTTTQQPTDTPPATTVAVSLPSRRPPVKKHNMHTLIRAISVPGDYSFVLATDPEAQDIFKRALDSVNGSEPLSVDQVLSIRSTLQKDRTMQRVKAMYSLTHKIAKMYANGKGILEIAKMYDIPPVSCFRCVLRSRNLNKQQIKNATKNPERYLSKPRDREQLQLAAQHDASSQLFSLQELEASKQFEVDLESALASLGVSFETESVLQDRHQVEMSKYQDALAKHEAHVKRNNLTFEEARSTKPVRPERSMTPDFLITSEFKVQGVQINWIDAKNYFGMDCFLVKKTVAQIEKYHDRWGSGALVFSQGFSARFSDIIGNRARDKAIVVDHANLLGASAV